MISVHIPSGMVVWHFMLISFFLLLIIDMAGLFVVVVACITSNMHFNFSFLFILIVILTRFWTINYGRHIELICSIFPITIGWSASFLCFAFASFWFRFVSFIIFIVRIFFIWFLRPEFSSLLRQYNARVNMNLIGCWMPNVYHNLCMILKWTERQFYWFCQFLFSNNFVDTQQIVQNQILTWFKSIHKCTTM